MVGLLWSFMREVNRYQRYETLWNSPKGKARVRNCERESERANFGVCSMHWILLPSTRGKAHHGRFYQKICKIYIFYFLISFLAANATKKLSYFWKIILFYLLLNLNLILTELWKFKISFHWPNSMEYTRLIKIMLMNKIPSADCGYTKVEQERFFF